MKLKYFVSLLVAGICLVAATQAFASAKKAKANFKLVTAYSKNIPENKQTNPPMAGYFFVIQWESASYPETFFWRGESGWLTCNIEKARKTTKNGKTEYTGTTIGLDKIRKGDLLLLTPVTGGRFPIPAEIPQDAKNTLFYKTAGSAWLSFPVNKISKK